MESVVSMEQDGLLDRFRKMSVFCNVSSDFPIGLYHHFNHE